MVPHCWKLKEVEYNALPGEYGLNLMPLFQQVLVQKGEGVEATGLSLSKHYLRQAIRFIPLVVSHVGTMNLWYDEEMSTSSLWSSSPKPITLANHEKNISPTQIEECSAKSLTSPLQNGQGHQKKISLRDYHRLEEAEETRHLKARRYPGWDPRAEKGQEDETSKIWLAMVLVIDNVPTLVP